MGRGQGDEQHASASVARARKRQRRQVDARRAGPAGLDAGARRRAAEEFALAVAVADGVASLQTASPDECVDVAGTLNRLGERHGLPARWAVGEHGPVGSRQRELLWNLPGGGSWTAEARDFATPVSVAVLVREMAADLRAGRLAG